MKHSRRELGLLLPALAALKAPGQSPALPSRTFRYEDLPVRESGENRSRAVFDGKTHTGSGIEMHETELGPGLMPHAAHHHVHEELVIVRDGTLEVTIEGKGSKLGPGSVAYVASNEEHGWRNVGATRARYFVVTIGRSA